MTLETYRRKRRSDQTPERRGEAVHPTDSRLVDQGRYVVQRHRATRLHHGVRPKRRARMPVAAVA